MLYSKHNDNCKLWRSKISYNGDILQQPQTFSMVKVKVIGMLIFIPSFVQSQSPSAVFRMIAMVGKFDMMVTLYSVDLLMVHSIEVGILTVFSIPCFIR